MDFPADFYEVHVVADNCSDQTATVAVQNGAQVHIRKDDKNQGKGYALNWLLEQVDPNRRQANALVFLDADSVVSANFLQVMVDHLERGEKVIQAYYSVRDPSQSWAGSLRYAALTVLHYLRPLGRMALGASAGLKGNGMVFATGVMNHYSWSPSLTEDIELHMSLLLSGERVTFAPEAIVWGEMPDNLPSSSSQHMRWELGKMQMARKYIPKLLVSAWHELCAARPRRTFLLIDAVMEFLQPPFSILAGASLVGVAVSLFVFLYLHIVPSLNYLGVIRDLATFNILLAVGLLIGQGAYLFAGLRSASAPKHVFIHLFYTPRLVIWKTWQMILALTHRRQFSWARTKRNKE